MLTDYHLHLRPDDPACTPARFFTGANVDRYRAVAEEQGIAELGVSEHIYRFREALSLWDHPFWQQYAVDDLERYVDFVREETDLRLGIEADFVRGREDRTANLLERYELDYVVGAVHFLGDAAVDHGEWDVWHGVRTADSVWKQYFLTLGAAARSGLFDILAHPDLVKVWGSSRPRPEGDLRRFYELALEGIVESGVALEVSTAGLRKPVGEIYPARALLEMCVEAGVPIALSSDAHRPQDVGAGYAQALELLKAVGVGELCVFDRRRRRMEPLGS